MIGIGSVVDRIRMVNGKSAGRSDRGIIKKISLRAGKDKTLMDAKRGKLSLELNAPNLGAAGFDTEGITVSGFKSGKTNPKIQVSIVDGGISYKTVEFPVAFSLNNNESGGKINGRIARWVAGSRQILLSVKIHVLPENTALPEWPLCVKDSEGTQKRHCGVIDGARQRRIAMSSPSSQEENDHPVRRGKTTFHGLKATPKVLRPVQPDHVYDSYDHDPQGGRRSREERRPRRSSSPPDLATFGMFAFFGVLALGVIFYLVQGASPMEIERTGDTQEEIKRKNEEARRINEQRAREAALHPPLQPVQRETPVIPPAAARRETAPAPVTQSTADVRPERPSPIGGISAGMVPPDLQHKVQAEPRKDAPDAAVPAK